MVEFSSFKISNCLGFERRQYVLKQMISETPNIDELSYEYKIKLFFEKFGKVNEYPFGRKLIKVKSPMIEISLVLNNNQFIVTFIKPCQLDFENALRGIQ